MKYRMAHLMLLHHGWQTDLHQHHLLYTEMHTVCCSVRMANSWTHEHNLLHAGAPSCPAPSVWQTQSYIDVILHKEQLTLCCSMRSAKYLFTAGSSLKAGTRGSLRDAQGATSFRNTIQGTFFAQGWTFLRAKVVCASFSAFQIKHGRCERIQEKHVVKENHLVLSALKACLRMKAMGKRPLSLRLIHLQRKLTTLTRSPGRCSRPTTPES